MCKFKTCIVGPPLLRVLLTQLNISRMHRILTMFTAAYGTRAPSCGQRQIRLKGVGLMHRREET